MALELGLPTLVIPELLVAPAASAPAAAARLVAVSPAVPALPSLAAAGCGARSAIGEDQNPSQAKLCR